MPIIGSVWYSLVVALSFRTTCSPSIVWRSTRPGQLIGHPRCIHVYSIVLPCSQEGWRGDIGWQMICSLLVVNRGKRGVTNCFDNPMMFYFFWEKCLKMFSWRFLNIISCWMISEENTVEICRRNQVSKRDPSGRAWAPYAICISEETKPPPFDQLRQPTLLSVYTKKDISSCRHMQPPLDRINIHKLHRWEAFEISLSGFVKVLWIFQDAIEIHWGSLRYIEVMWK